MATANSLKNQLAKKEGAGQPSAIANNVKGLWIVQQLRKDLKKFYGKSTTVYEFNS